MARRAVSTEFLDLLAVLADRTRLRLVNLMSGREICVCYFIEVLREGQPKISRHLSYMRRAGVVATRREGKWMHYRLQWPEGGPAAGLLATALLACAEDREMQDDLSRLGKACCSPAKFTGLVDAPRPVSRT